MGSGELVPVLPERVRSPTCPSIQFVKTFSHLFLKLLLLYFFRISNVLVLTVHPTLCVCVRVCVYMPGDEDVKVRGSCDGPEWCKRLYNPMYENHGEENALLLIAMDIGGKNTWE